MTVEALTIVATELYDSVNSREYLYLFFGYLDVRNQPSGWFDAHMSSLVRKRHSFPSSVRYSRLAKMISASLVLLVVYNIVKERRGKHLRSCKTHIAVRRITRAHCTFGGQNTARRTVG